MTRREVLGGASLSLVTGMRAFAAEWLRYVRPDAAGFRSAALEQVERSLYSRPTTCVMVVRGGKIAWTYGDITRASNIASVRKSIMSMLYGKYVASGAIDLDRTVGELGIEEDGEGLSTLERSARVRDLLISSSGVYWPAGSPSGSSIPTPARGSKKPGTHFFYNNWDLNVLGAIFEKLTGKSVFQALEEDLAQPLGFQDFDRKRQRMLAYADQPSRYASYQMFLSPRDMARLGVLMLSGGVWSGKRILPFEWVRESTRVRVKASDIATGTGPLGYSYLWWNPSEGRKTPDWEESYLAVGAWGQFILCLPAIDTVIVHARSVPDEYVIAFNLGKVDAQPFGGPFTSSDFLPIADAIVAARV